MKIMKEKTGPEALDDDLLDEVVGGLVQMGNPSSNRLTLREGMTVRFGDGRTCPACGHEYFLYSGSNMTNYAHCKKCAYEFSGFSKYDVHYVEV